MNSVMKKFSRRTFLLSGAAMAASWASARANAAPLRVHVIGWGRHGRRFQGAVRARQLSIASVLDTQPARVRLATRELCSIQAFAPAGHCALPSFLEACDGSPIILCSSPVSWPSLLRSLSVKGDAPPVLVHHTDCFDARMERSAREALDEYGENAFLAGLDPAWPRLSLSSFFDFASTRGATRSLAQLEHPGWPPAQLGAFHFDYLDCAATGTPDFDAHDLQAFSLPRLAKGLYGPHSNCRFVASGAGLEFEATMEIGSSSSRLDRALLEPCEGLEAFLVFVASSFEQRRTISYRQRLLMNHVLATYSAC
jgi:hypothetical protein